MSPHFKFFFQSNRCGLFHHNLSYGLTIVGLNVHHVDALGHVRQVDADLFAINFAVVDGLPVGIHDADVVDAFALKGDFALGRVGVDLGSDVVLADAFSVFEMSHEVTVFGGDEGVSHM